MTRSVNSSPAVDTLVDVGGYRLHFRVWRRSGPTILLEAGGGADAAYWESLPMVLRRETGATIVVYDRAGYGESDLPDTPYDVQEEIAGLWRGLEQLDLTNSVIPVGHSYGGLLIQLLASEYSSAVRGLVFVDPMTVEFIDTIGGVEILIHHPLMQRPFDPVQEKTLTKPQQAALRVEAGLPGTVAIVRTKPVPHDIPVRVITAGQPWWPEPEENQAWREAHAHLAASVKDGQLLVAERSAHFVPQDQPEMVIAAVAELL